MGGWPRTPDDLDRKTFIGAANWVEWQTMMFASLAFLQIFQAIGTRSNTEPLNRLGWRTNATLLAIVATPQLVGLYTALNQFLHLKPLSLIDLGL